jgi:glutamate dehydrogenase
VLLSYSKMALYKQLISSDIASDPYLAQELQRYFPPALSQRFAKQLPKHRLAKEIIATAITNSLVNRMGSSFAMRAEQDTGADAAHIARAYAIGRESFQMRGLWEKIEALDNQVPATLQYQMLNASARLLRFIAYWLLNNYRKDLNIQQQVARLQPGLLELAANLPKLIPAATFSTTLQQLGEALHTNRVPQRLVQQIIYLDAMCSGPDIVELAAQHRRTVSEVATLYFGLDKLLSLDWLRAQIMALITQDRWQTLARNTLRDQLYALQRSLCAQILKANLKANPSVALSDWQKRNDAAIKLSQQSIQEIQSGNLVEFASLSVALQAVRKLVDI